MTIYNGSASNDTIYAGDGNDVLNGFAGNDELAGREGDDTLVGGAGNDILYGEYGVNTAVFSGNYADYIVDYDRHHFTITDTMPGRDGVDLAYSMSYLQFADQTLFWGTFQGYNITGTDGNDTLTGTNLPEIIEAGAGNDLIYGLAGPDYIGGGAGDDTIDGGTGNDEILGWIGSDSILGGAGNDSIQPGEGNDFVDGGAGIDVVGYGSEASSIVGSLATGFFYSAGWKDTLVGIENVAGSNYNDNITGDSAANDLHGASGDDTLFGAAGADTLHGFAGNDLLSGGDGDDLIDGESGWWLPGADTLDGGDGNDTLNANQGDDWLIGGAGNDLLDGGDGDDTAVFSGSYFDYIIAIEGLAIVVADTVASRDGVDRLTGVEHYRFADTGRIALSEISMFGTPGDDVFNGTEDWNTFKGLAGADTLNGAGGDDTLEGGLGNDFINGGAGVDTASYYSTWGAAVTVSLAISGPQQTVGLGIDTLLNVENLLGGDGDDRLTGNELANRLDGSGGADTLDGGQNGDTLVGGPGDDLYIVDSAADVVIEAPSSGVDTVNSTATFVLGDASVENLVLLGQSDIGATGNDIDNALTGNGGGNALSGLGGSDVLIGLGGADFLSGGDGNDLLFSASAIPNLAFPYSGHVDSPDCAGDADTLSGGSGDDLLFAGYGDSVDGGTNGIVGDRLFLSLMGAPAGVVADFRLLQTQSSIVVGGATIRGIEALESLEGSNFDDFLAGMNYAPSSFGTVLGIGGNDHILVGQYSDGAYGGAGNDLIELVGAGAAHGLYGDSGDDTLLGGLSGTDYLYGGDGNDVLRGRGGLDFISGGDGVDTAVFSGLRASRPVFIVDATAVVNGSTLDHVERVRCDDGSVALDLNGSAGIVAKVIGVLVGPEAVHNESLVGVGLRLTDVGYSAADLVDAALAALLGPAPSNEEVVGLLYLNLFGVAPTDSQAAPIVSLLQQGWLGQAEMAAYAANLDMNAVNINLTGLSATGLPYLPFG